MNHEETCIECGGKIIYTSSGGTCTLCGQPYTIHSTQTGPNAVYIAKVREVAEMLAKIHSPIIYSRYTAKGKTQAFSDRYYFCIEREISAARAMVAEMAKAYIDGAHEMGAPTKYAHERCFELGYIPSLPDVPHASLVDVSDRKWFNAECAECGWHGSSEFLLGGDAIGETGDYSDPLCPYCLSCHIEDYQLPDTKTDDDA